MNILQYNQWNKMFKSIHSNCISFFKLRFHILCFLTEKSFNDMGFTYNIDEQ